MVAWIWQNPSPALAFGFLPQCNPCQQQAGFCNRRNGGVRSCKKKRSVVLVVAASKRLWEGPWEPREVTLDKADLMQLEMRRLLGEPRDLSIAKVVAKKLNPSATNLEVEKFVKQKGVKPFLELLKTGTDEGVVEGKLTTKQPETKRNIDASLPVLLSPKPGLENSGLQAPPRRPRSADPDHEWPEEADVVLQQRFPRVVNEPVTRKSDDSLIPLSPKPRGNEPASRPSSSFASTSSDSAKSTPKSSKPTVAKPQKPVPELNSRPSRGGALEVFPNLKTATPPAPKDLRVPSLSIKPEMRLPTPPTVPEEEPEAQQEVTKKQEADLTLHKPVAFQNQKSKNSTENMQTGSGTASVVDSNLEIPQAEELKLREPATIRSTASEEAKSVSSSEVRVEVALPVLNKPSAKEKQGVQGSQTDLRMGATTKSELTVEKLNLRKPDTVPSSSPEESRSVSPASEAEAAFNLGVSEEVSAVDKSDTEEVGELASLVDDDTVSLRRPSAAQEKTEADEQDTTLGNSGSKLNLSNGSSRAAKVELDDTQDLSTTESLRRPTRKEQELQPDASEEVRKAVSPQKALTQEETDRDWALAEIARDTKSVHDVIFVGSNAGGMIVRFGCLNGFLPGKDFLESRGLKSFRSWARERGHDVNHTSVWDSSDGVESTFSSSKMSNQGLNEDADNQSLHPACESDINTTYRQHRTSLLASLVGQRANVAVTYVDKEKKKLIFSEKKAVFEDPAVAQRRAELLAKLKAGDVLKGNVRNISLFGVFVELVQGVSGLIHFSELSWTPVPDPAKLVKVGEELEAMVYKLDHDRQRIYLSLKRMSPDPLLESVESMLAKNLGSDSSSLDSEASTVPELEALLAKLESQDGIQEVVKGRRLNSAAVVPSFQVYLSSTLPEEGYKLLARFGNEVQEVLVQTSLERDSLIAIIRESTANVEEEEVIGDA